MWKDIGKNPILDIEFLDKNGKSIVPGVIIQYKSKIRGKDKYVGNEKYEYIPGKTIDKQAKVLELIFRVRLKRNGECEIMKGILVRNKYTYGFRIYRYDLVEIIGDR